MRDMTESPQLCVGESLNCGLPECGLEALVDPAHVQGSMDA